MVGFVSESLLPRQIVNKHHEGFVFLLYLLLLKVCEIMDCTIDFESKSVFCQIKEIMKNIIEKDKLKVVQAGKDDISSQISDPAIMIHQCDSKNSLDNSMDSNIPAAVSQGLDSNFFPEYDKDIVSKILTYKFEDGLTYLHLQVLEKDICVVKKLLDLGANVNAEDDFQRRPLHFARTVELAELLINNGAEINAKDKNGKTALSIAYVMGKIQLVKFLLEKGADFSDFKEYRKLPSNMTETQLLHSMMYDDDEM